MIVYKNTTDLQKNIEGTLVEKIQEHAYAVKLWTAFLTNIERCTIVKFSANVTSHPRSHDQFFCISKILFSLSIVLTDITYNLKLKSLSKSLVEGRRTGGWDN